MSVEKAKAHYSGKGGHGKLNCAEAIAYAFRGTYPLADTVVAGMAACGTGRAPGGECGALFAAKAALRDTHADKVKACSAAFAAQAGATRCKEIRALKKLPCLGCVETAAAFLEETRPAGAAACTTCGESATQGETMSLERQVRMMAGTLVVIGSVLSWVVHPAFAAVAIMIGCGLVYAGITDNCFATLLLSKLPWNKRC